MICNHHDEKVIQCCIFSCDCHPERNEGILCSKICRQAQHEGACPISTTMEIDISSSYASLANLRRGASIHLGENASC